MGRSFHTFGIFLAAGIVVAACGSVSGNDPSFWQPSHGIGGPQNSGPGAGGTGAAPSTGGGPGAGGTGSGGSGTGSGGSGTGSGGSGTGSGGSGTGSGGSGTGSGGSGTGSGGSGPVNSGLCQFSFDVTTVSAGGRFSPRNIEATWISTSSNQFVKTLEVHAKTRIIHLVNWNKAAGGNKVDAITSATLSSPQAHHVTWNCTNTSEQPVPDGNYRVYFEFTEDDSAYPFTAQPQLGHVDFQKGKAQTLSPPDQKYFKSMQLSIK